jgi:hypothetical protein
MSTRRTFLISTLPGAVLAAATAPTAFAQSAKLEESAPPAVALGYKHDASKVDKAKHPTYVAGRNCANCQLFAAKGNAEWAPCAAVGNKLVAAKGWCIAWVKKV